MNTLIKSSIIGLLTTLLCGVASAESNWSLRVGVHMVEPDSDNGGLVQVDSATSLTFDITYRINPNWRVEILAAAPFNHDINLVGAAKVAEADHLPPTVSVQYFFLPENSFSPFIGLGANATIFFNEETSGALAGTTLELDTSIGVAASLGADIRLSKNMFATGVVRFIDIETDASLDGVDIGTVAIDPVVFGLSLGWQFD